MKQKHLAHAAAALKFSTLTGISADNIGQARNLLREVGSLAALALDVFRRSLSAGEETEDLQSCVSLLRRLLDRIGWVADVGLRELGEPAPWQVPKIGCW